MKKYVEYESFYNDYSVSQINCIDLSIGAHLGQIDKEKYYIYCFMIAVLNNYENSIFKNIKHKKDYEDAVRTEVLRLMGYKQDFKTIDNKESLIEEIKKCIEEKNPLFIDAKYQTLFFYKNYNDEKETKFTTFIVNGINDENDTINILDMSLERQTFSRIFKGEFLYPLQITSDMLQTIIDNTKELTKDYDSFLGDKTLFYTIEKLENNPTIIETKDAIKYFINLIPNNDMINNALQKLISVENYKPNALETIMKRHINPYQVIIDGLLRYFKNHEEFNTIFDNLMTFIKNRRMMIAGLTRTYIKNHYINEIELKACKEKISDNVKLLDIILNKMCEEKLDNSQKNLVRGSLITASTMLTDASYMSKREVNLKEDCWLSKVTTINHWIKFDLLESKNINVIKIYHYGEESLNTRNFEVLGSKDDNSYENISLIENNASDVTEIKDINRNYRFIKVTITVPCQFDSRARIRNVIVES